MVLIKINESLFNYKKKQSKNFMNIHVQTKVIYHKIKYKKL